MRTHGAVTIRAGRILTHDLGENKWLGVLITFGRSDMGMFASAVTGLEVDIGLATRTLFWQHVRRSLSKAGYGLSQEG